MFVCGKIFAQWMDAKIKNMSGDEKKQLEQIINTLDFSRTPAISS